MKFVIVLIALFALATAQHCHECEQVVQLIEEFTHENSTESFVIGHLTHVCNLFPAQRAAKCHTAVAANKDALFKAIIAKTKPTQVCTVMTLCPDSKVEENIDLKAVRAAVHGRARVQNRDPTECFLCTSIFQYAEGYISANSTEEEVEQFLNKVVCPLLGPLQSECVQLVQEYPQIIQYLIQNESPQVACTQLSLCPSPKAKKVVEKVVEKKVEKVESGDPVGCSLCTYIVAALEDYIADNATEAQLQQIIANEICPTLPTEFQPQCHTFAKELPQYIADLEKNEPPTKACTDAGVCPAPKNEKKSPRLGVNH